ncbi:Fe-S cluster assembly protein NifU [Desulfoplanes formicivorans]|uniref:Nitrogen fixation protein NifU n=1 Tax=Desulfoplanes formicivorans TaxID=1592317 RepID=A0A194AMP6_9BACT|nr:Fe-S cluster assembly protein NifU [Desulfoplanes formicivorans]GAU09894.1 nitrogen fixation protein NifU [Desulfoplanes formicivorans]
MWDYTDKVKEHFLHPKNAGAMEDADAVGEVGSLACGDALKLYLKVDENERIVEASFQTFGCASAIASSSALTELIKGKTLEEAKAISNKDIADFLGGLPRQKMHCSVMGREALDAAIDNYKGISRPKEELEGEILCHCFGVTEEKIRQAIMENNLTTVEDVTSFTKAGGGCGECLEDIGELLDKVRAEMKKRPPVEKQPAGLSNVQRMQLVMKTLEDEIRPSLKQDGGNIELVDIIAKKVLVRLQGTCSHCPASKATLKGFVEAKLREQVEPDIQVEEVVS